MQRLAELAQQTRQVDRVILVDNDSPDGTGDLVARSFPAVRLLRLPENLGPAGGYAAGFRAALEEGCDFIWAIDDDVELTPDCLQRLLLAAAAAPGSVVFPTRLPSDKPQGVGWHAVLIPAPVVRTAGVPRPELFWWIEDTEYFIHRIRDLGGIGLITAADAVVRHQLHRPRRGYPGWKLYYETRNTMFYRFHLRPGAWKRVRSVARFTARLLLVLFREERGAAKAWLMARGFWDGWVGRLGKIVDPADETARPDALSVGPPV